MSGAVGYTHQSERGRNACRILLLCFLVASASGCMSSKISSPEQTAVEQLLLSTAADRAVAGLDFDAYDGKQVFLDTQYL